MHSNLNKEHFLLALNFLTLAVPVRSQCSLLLLVLAFDSNDTIFQRTELNYSSGGQTPMHARRTHGSNEV